MKNRGKTNIVLGIIASLVLVGGLLHHLSGTTEQNHTEKNKKEVEKINDEKEEDTIVMEGDYDYVIPGIEGHEVAICQLDSIERSDNLNPITNNRDTNIVSFGTLNIKKVLQGRMNPGKIKFVTMGGKVSMEKYYEGMYPKTKRRTKRKSRYTKNDMKRIKIEHDRFGTVKKLKTKKDFICYLRYDKVRGMYSLISLPEMLRGVIKYSRTGDEITVEDVEKQAKQGKGMISPRGVSGEPDKKRNVKTFKNIKEFDKDMRS